MKRGVGSAVLAMLATLTVVSAAAAAPPPDKPPSSHSGVPQLSQRAAVVKAAPAEAGKPPEGIDSNVDAVRKAYAVRGKPAALVAAQKRSMRVRGGRLCVVVEAQVGGLSAARASLAALDAQIDSSYDSLIRAYVPVGRIGKLAAAPGVMLVRRPMTPHHDIQSEGVGEIGASDWHSEGWRGAGTKVGIVDVGFRGYAAGLGSELPPAGQVLTWGGSGYPEDGGGPHGTAVAEIVHDVAPGATLYLARVEDEVDIGNAVQWLLGQGVDVVNMSLGWPAWGLGDGTGQVNEIVTGAVSAGVFWANSVGNDRLGHWKGDFADTNGNDFMDWGVVDSSPWEVNTFWAAQGAPILGVLRWQDSWGFADQDYDLGLHRWTGDAWVPVAFGQSVQDGEPEDRPFEEVLTEAAEAGVYGWTIYRYDATETAVSFDLNMKDGLLDDPGNPNPYWYDHSRSLSPPADNASHGFMAAAAVGRAPDYTQESYSAEGPTRDLRVAPEIAAPANVSTSPYAPFGGTSASSPHLAGAAALVHGLSPSWTAAELETYLRSRAVDLGAPGSDLLYGFGRLHLPLPTTPWVVTLNLSDTEVAPGETVTYSGSVKTDGGADGSGTVTVQKRRAGTTSWSNWRTKTLNASGEYSVNVAMTTADREWEFRTRMPGDASNATGFSPTKTLTVLPPQPWVVTLDLSDDEISAGETVTYSGSVKTAAGANGTGAVTLQKRRLGSSWSNWRTKTLNASGEYSVNVAMTTADRDWEFRTRMLASGTNLKGFSPTKSLTVLPPSPWVVTLNLSDDEITAGETVKYSGTVKSAGGANGTGKVTLQKRRAGTTSWSNWRTKTLSSGKYAVSVAMTTADREWEFRTRMPANSANQTGFSSTKTLTVLPPSPWVVTLTLSDDEISAGETVTYSGSVKTAGGADGTGTVTLQKRAAGTTSWSNWRTKTLSSGSYTIKVAMTTADREWEFRTRMPANSANQTGFSPVKSLTVAAL